MAQCAQCGTSVPDEAKFCQNCGSQVSDAEGQAEATASMDRQSFAHMEQLLRDDTAGEFEIEGALGKGGMAVVYLATEVHLSRKVAIKVLPPELTFGHGVERFKREAKTAAALDHPNIIPIYRIASGGKIFWYAMKYLEGRSLDDILREKGSFSLKETIKILDQTADALDYAHEHQVIHRDMKPANVMLDSRNRVVVTDFGIAKALTEGTLTASGSVVGTPYYMSPEQGMGRPVTGAADQYSVGVMAYRMLSGSVPFEGESAVEILHKHCMVPPPPLESVKPGLPKHVYWAVHKALEKKPEKRHATMAAFVEALEHPSDEMTMGEQATVVVSADMVAAAGEAAAAGAYTAGGYTAGDPPSAEMLSGATVPMARTSPPTPATPTPAVGVAAPPKSKKGLVVAILGAAVIGFGGVGAWVALSGGGTSSTTEEVAQGPAGATTDPSGIQTPAGAVAESTAVTLDPAAAEPEPPEDTATAVAEPPQTPQPQPQREQQVTRPAVTPPPAPTTGFIRLASIPSGSVVLLNGRRRTDNPIEVPPGTYRIVVNAEGWETFDVEYAVRAGETRRVTFDARRLQMTEMRISLGVVARITIDGEFVDENRRYRGEFPVGKHTISIRADGYAPLDTTVTLQADGTANIFRFELQQR
jgi:serine/threonine-protein kinase